MKHNFIRFLQLANIKCEEMGMRFTLVSTENPDIMMAYAKKFNRADPHRPFLSSMKTINIHEEIKESIIYDLVHELQVKENAYMQVLSNDMEVKLENE